MLVKNDFVRFVKHVDLNYDNTVVLELDKELFGSDSNVFLVCTYLNPINSPFYDGSEFDNGISMLEQCLLSITEKNEYVNFIVCGDLNARTASNVPSYYDLEQSGCDAFVDMCDNNVVNDCSVLSQRCSQDDQVNLYGQWLLSLCSCFDLHILNGSCEGDKEGRFTYISSHGNSVIDYYLFSRSLYLVLNEMCVLDRIDSKHMPISCSIQCRKQPVPPEKDIPVISKLVWSDDKLDAFAEALNSLDNAGEFDKAKNLIDVDIDQAIEAFTHTLTSAASCMTKKQTNSRKTKNDWFDDECREKRKETRKALRLFWKSLSSADRISYCETRKQYKKLLSEKEKQFKTKCRQELENNLGDPKKFWGSVKKFSSRGKQMGDISEEQWLNHFKRVFDAEEVQDNSSESFRFSESGGFCETDQNDLLDADITKEEVAESIQHLKAHKAAGPDGIVPEIFKHSASTIIPFLVRLFNVIFTSGQYPKAWSEAIIHPLHKKGSLHVPDNYRGISLLNVCSKLYSYIINKRLSKFVEENDILGEIQAGFRKDHSTIDHIFTLFSMIQRYLLRNKKLYVAFIDFRKAFDLISHCKLWPILQKSGIKGKMLRTIQSMYRTVKARIRSGCTITEAFYCSKGLKQGEITSPLIFSLFINELATDIINNGRHGVQLIPDMIQLFILLFADDIVLLSDSVIGLQNQLNVLARKSAALDLQVNLDKSNIVIFRNGGYISKMEKWYFNGQIVTTVNSYKYLGLFLTTRLKFTEALDHMSMKAKKGVIEIFKTLWRLGDFSVTIFLKLFDAQIKPMLLYGSELWGLQSHPSIEKVHTFALKKLLNVSPRTPNDIVYGETGRYPLYIFTYVACIKFWLRVTRMESFRLPRKAYDMLLSLHNSGVKCWATSVCDCLYSLGFGYVWENQGVQSPDSFLKVFKQRLVDIHYQNWHDHITSSSRFDMYRVFKTSIFIEPYFHLVNNKHIRDTLIRFRVGASEVRSHKMRYTAQRPEDLRCPFCNFVFEDEMHFLFFCEKLAELRKKYIPSKYLVYPTLDTFKALMQSKKCVEDLGRFIYHSNKLRSTLLDT